MGPRRDVPEPPGVTPRKVADLPVAHAVGAPLHSFLSTPGEPFTLHVDNMPVGFD